MKNILLLIILLLMLLNSLTYPQSQYPTNSKNIESKIDSLEHLKAILQNEIIKIDSTISILDEKKIQLEFSKFKSNKLFITSSKNLKAEFRSAPVLHPANVIATIPTNTKLEVLGADENDFLKLIFKNKEGYVLRFLTNIDDKQYNVLKSNYLLKLEVQKIRLDSLISEIEIDRIWVKSYTANVRQEPSSSAKIFIKLEQGEEIYKQKSMNGWIKIKFRNPNFSRKDVNTIDDIKKLFFEGWIYNNLTSNSKIKKLVGLRDIKLTGN